MTNPPVLQRERDLAALISDTFTIYGARWALYARLVAPVVVVSAIVGVLTASIPLGDEAEPDLDMVGLWLLAFLGSLPVVIIVYQLASAGLILVLNEGRYGRELGASQALRLAEGKVGPLVGAQLRAGVIVFLFAITLFGLPWAIKRGINWILLAQVVIFDNLRGQSVLAASAALVQPRWWSTLGRLLVVGLIMQAPAIFLNQLFGAFLPATVTAALSSLTGFITYPLGIISTTLIYFDLKEKAKHDLSPDRFADSQQDPPGQGA